MFTGMFILLCNDLFLLPFALGPGSISSPAGARLGVASGGGISGPCFCSHPERDVLAGAPVGGKEKSVFVCLVDQGTGDGYIAGVTCPLYDICRSV